MTNHYFATLSDDFAGVRSLNNAAFVSAIFATAPSALRDDVQLYSRLYWMPVPRLNWLMYNSTVSAPRSIKGDAPVS